MSFILDALKKLEREKEAREPGVVMVGAVPWGGRDRRGRGLGLVLGAAALLVTLGGAFLWLRSGPESAPPGGAHEETAAPAAPQAPPVAGTSTPEVPPLEASSPPSPPPPEVAATAPPPLERDVAPPREASPAVGSELATRSEEDVPPPSSTTPAASEPEFRLAAISSRDGHPIALLNDRLVREGDSFDGITVVSIGETSVEIEVSGERRTIGF